MSNTLYVNKPGGVIVPFVEGGSRRVGYGEPIDPDRVIEGGRRYLRDVADTTFRGTAADAATEREAHARAALADNGQVHQASSPVPSNYSELDEDTKVRLVENLTRYPESQAQLLIHERLFAGDSQKVWDAATDYARVSATMQIEQAASTRMAREAGPALGVAQPPVGDVEVDPHDPGATARIAARLDAQAAMLQTPPPVGRSDDGGGQSAEVEALRARQAELEQQLQEAREAAGDPSRGTPPPGATVFNPDTRGSGSPDGGDAPESYESFSYKQLQGYARQHGLNEGDDGVALNASKDELASAIASRPGHEKPQTPPPADD